MKSRSQRRKRGRPDDRGGRGVGADAIVRKACELLREVAPRDMTLLRVAKYAGVDRALIRYYFTNRASLMLAVARRLLGQMQDELSSARSIPTDDAETRLRELARGLLRFQIKHPYFHRLIVEEVVNSDDPEARAFFKTFTAAGIAGYRATTAAAARRVGIRPVEGAFVYMATIGMCEFFVTGAPILKIAFGKDFDAKGVEQQYEKFICDYVVDGLRKR